MVGGSEVSNQGRGRVVPAVAAWQRALDERQGQHERDVLDGGAGKAEPKHGGGAGEAKPKHGGGAGEIKAPLPVIRFDTDSEEYVLLLVCIAFITNGWTFDYVMSIILFYTNYMTFTRETCPVPEHISSQQRY